MEPTAPEQARTHAPYGSPAATDMDLEDQTYQPRKRPIVTNKDVSTEWKHGSKGRVIKYMLLWALLGFIVGGIIGMIIGLCSARDGLCDDIFVFIFRNYNKAGLVVSIYPEYPPAAELQSFSGLYTKHPPARSATEGLRPSMHQVDAILPSSKYFCGPFGSEIQEINWGNSLRRGENFEFLLNICDTLTFRQYNKRT
ncbi:hypothetical protein L228DRAFT_285996 [Xylona heveae TC161]|uniref:Uncharacterized protein n=1 Tax=Xylona heveae (strain CBS 132557 / TC161) TaxID=1328760 RepID=A0A164ZI90_XYLHT|nr:hypothetical protein L228DRAFT_285996 [Xylona heveae TC161]KZF19130.1 hypothetical protein L228DRAFT_285996 [Xylona heveae TC161]